MKKLAMIMVILMVAVMVFGYTPKLSESHEGFKGEPLATFNSYAKETEEEIIIAKTYVYAPNQISGIDMPEGTIAVIYFRTTDPTYMEIYVKNLILVSLGEFVVKGSAIEEYKKYRSADNTYVAHIIDNNFFEGFEIFITESHLGRSDRELYYIVSPIIDKTKEYTVHLKIGEIPDFTNKDIVINEGK